LLLLPLAHSLIKREVLRSISSHFNIDLGMGVYVINPIGTFSLSSE
jgi:hypothetical protein